MNAENKKDLTASDGEEGLRLDLGLAQKLSGEFSRSRIQKLIKQKNVSVNGREVTSHYRLKAGDKIHMEWEPETAGGLEAEDIPFEILFEDDDLIVVNKSAGIVVHPGAGNSRHTLVNALLHHVKSLSTLGGAARPGIVHRLDKDTSGILVVSKNDRTHALLARQFKDHSIDRVYHAVVQGVVQHDEGVCEEPVGRAFLNRKKVMIKPAGGKTAATYYRVLKRFARASMLEIRPRTGRTHQIRVHMAYLGHPVLGDGLYGVSSKLIGRQALHASKLGFKHPGTGKRLSFESPLPEDILELVKRLEAAA